MKAILDKFDIDETLTKPIKKNKLYTRVKSIVPLVKNWNYAIDVIELPETKDKFDRLLTICDLANNAFDIEPMKKNKSPDETMKALNKIFKRKYIQKPKYSITSDSGVEFKGAFDKFCKDNAILHRVGLTGRHTQNAVVERLHREIGRIINGYLNSKERTICTNHAQRTTWKGYFIIKTLTQLNKPKTVINTNLLNLRVRFLNNLISIIIYL